MIIGLKDVFGTEISVFDASFGAKTPSEVAKTLILRYSSPTKQALGFENPIARASNTGAFVNQILKPAEISGFLWADGAWWVFNLKGEKFEPLPGQQMTIEVEE